MFVYFHGTKDGYNTVQTFHKVEKASEYVIAQIDSYIAGKPTSGKKSSFKKIRQAGVPQPVGGGFQPRPLAPFVQQIGIDEFDLPVDPIIPLQLNINTQGSKPLDKSKLTEDKATELETLLAHMVLARKSKTFDNAIRAIKLYEEYAKYVLGSDATLHTLEEIKVAS